MQRQGMNAIRLGHAAHLEPAAICYALGLQLVTLGGELRVYDGPAVACGGDWSRVWRWLCQSGRIAPVVC